MSYNKKFTTMIKEADNTLAGCVEVFNYVADSRYFEHMCVSLNDSGTYNNGENTFEVSCVEDLYKELGYWLSCYYECGNIRHDEEFSDRKMIIRAMEVLKNYCTFDVTNFYFDIPYTKDTMNLIR